MLTTLAILWLTLAPKPLGENPPELFPGADKLVHAIMFGGLASMMLLDIQRKNRWRPVTGSRVWICALISSIFGALIEVAQAGMGMGRGFEFTDIIADTIGAFFFVAMYIFLQKIWAETPYK